MIQHFYKQSGSLEHRDQIQNLALAEYLWQRDYKYSPFASWRGTVINISLGPQAPALSLSLYIWLGQVSASPSAILKEAFC